MPDQFTLDRVRAPDRRIPTRLDAALFEMKTAVFRLHRGFLDLGARVERLPRGAADDFPHVVAISRSPLWADPRLAEAAMQRGKVHNLRAAARRLDRTLIAPGAVFSFWTQVGRAARSRGFARGRMLQEGCLVASTGGGLCQLSNALYDVALQANCEILERHAHSRIVPGSSGEAGRDATVAWNYVDLRFRAPQPLMLRVTLDREMLIVALLSAEAKASTPESVASAGAILDRAHDCATCGETSCFRHGEGRGQARGARAFVVDEYWPEFDNYIGSVREAGDLLCAPLDARAKRANYAWRNHGLAAHTAPLSTFMRSQRSRNLSAQGAARQTVLLSQADRLARVLARQLNEDITDVCVAAPFLPELWRDGHLGGRRFAVFMTRLPLSAIHAKLDAAAAKHPDRRTLSDFRASPEMVALEDVALAQAAAVITPHAAVAAHFGERAVVLPWKTPAVASAPRMPKRLVLFPGPTVARKGAFELREATRALDVEVQVMGAQIEGATFWDAAPTRREGDWLSEAAAVVQPALIEDKPRLLLRALAAGVPVIATPACGLPPRAGLTFVPEDDVTALSAAIAAVLPN